MKRYILKFLGEKVRQLRVKKGLSQEELGIKAGLHRTYIGSIERGERNVSLLNIERIARALGVSEYQLIRKEEKVFLINGDGGTSVDLSRSLHIASIYRSRQEQLAALIPFIAGTIKNNEKLVCIGDHGIKDVICAEIDKLGLSYKKCSEWGKFDFLSNEELYFKGRAFQPERALNEVKRIYHKALEEGFPGMRMTAVVDRELLEAAGSSNFIKYEVMMNYFIPYNKIMGLCQYEETQFSEDVLLDVIHTHRKVYFNGNLVANSHHRPPDIFWKPDRNESAKIVYENMKQDLLSEGFPAEA